MKYIVQINDKRYEVEVEKGKATLLSTATIESPVSAPVSTPVPAAPAPSPAVEAGGMPVKAPMPGTVLSVPVQEGQAVKKGDLLLTIEAMKMENEIMAPQDGTVAQILTARGAAVDTGAVLLTLR